jgi:hypothetical protein
MLIICKCAQAHSPTYADTDIRDSIYARVAQATSQTDIGSNSCEEMSHRVRPKAQTDFTVLAQQAPPPCALLASPAADWRFQAERDLSAILPIPWTPALMGDGKDGNHLANHLVHHRIGEVPQVVAPDFIVVLGPVHGSYLQAVNRVNSSRKASATMGLLSKYQRNASRASASASGRTSTSKELTGN